MQNMETAIYITRAKMVCIVFVFSYILFYIFLNYKCIKFEVVCEHESSYNFKRIFIII